MESRSSRSAWIEILIMTGWKISRSGRAPRGARGLKLNAYGKESSEAESRSSRSAWIEIKSKRGKEERKYVALLAERVD